jgi:hypothetical protein
MAHEPRTHQGPHWDRAESADLAGRRARWRLGAQVYDEYHVFVRVAEAGHYYVEFLAPLAQSEFTTDEVIPPTPRTGGAPPA